MGKVREPIKSTSKDKKNRIIEAGLEVFCKKGYYSTTTPDIAAAAGVSTGIVYSYFKDKNDIFLQALDLYFERVYHPLMQKIEAIKFNNLSKTIDDLIDLAIKTHSDNFAAHEEMIAMSHLDEKIHERFMVAEQRLTYFATEILKKNGIDLPNLRERAHIAYNMIENLSHEYVFHKHDFIDYAVMKKQISALVLNLFTTV